MTRFLSHFGAAGVRFVEHAQWASPAHRNRSVPAGAAFVIASLIRFAHRIARETRAQIGRAHVCTPVPNAHLVCRLRLETKPEYTVQDNLPHQHTQTYEYATNDHQP